MRADHRGFPLPGGPAAALGEGGEDEILDLSNQRVALRIDARTGAFIDIHNKQTGLHHKADDDAGSWPFGMELAGPEEGDVARIAIAPGAAHPQTMRRELRAEDDGQTTVLVMRYENMVTTKGSPSGVDLTARIALKSDQDYFLIRATVVNGGDYRITKFASGGTGLVAGASRENETLAVPGWDYGKLWPNPHASFEERATFGYPIFGSHCALNAGWMDLYGERGGIGIGYLNRQGLTMLFNVQRSGSGMQMNWQLLDIVHDESPWGHVGSVHALAPGESLTTDAWILAPHAGDWHRMADIYRAEYERAFEGDYLTWDKTSAVAREIDFVTSVIISNKLGDGPPRSFASVPDYIRKLAQDTGIDVEGLLVAILGQNETWPIHMPDFTPCNPDAGGDEGCAQMMDDLRRMGAPAALLYGHPYYNHPEASDYVADADTGYEELNRVWADIGNVACTDSGGWQDLWREKYIPAFERLGASGVYWDQGPTQYLVCPRTDHPHGRRAADQLSAHVRGVLKMQRAFRDGYGNTKPISWTEVGSDIQGRTMDIWTATEGGYASGGILTREIGRYAIPYRLCAATGATSAADMNDTLVNGFIGWLALMPGNEEVMAAQRQHARIRRELRSAAAPGFPHGFRDNVGLAVGHPSLTARSFRDDDGITILYHARESVDSEILVDASALGFPGGGTEALRVTLAKHEAGFRIIRLKGAK